MPVSRERRKRRAVEFTLSEAAISGLEELTTRGTRSATVDRLIVAWVWQQRNKRARATKEAWARQAAASGGSDGGSGSSSASSGKTTEG